MFEWIGQTFVLKRRMCTFVSPCSFARLHLPQFVTHWYFDTQTLTSLFCAMLQIFFIFLSIIIHLVCYICNSRSSRHRQYFSVHWNQNLMNNFVFPNSFYFFLFLFGFVYKLQFRQIWYVADSPSSFSCWQHRPHNKEQSKGEHNKTKTKTKTNRTKNKPKQTILRVFENPSPTNTNTIDGNLMYIDFFSLIFVVVTPFAICIGISSFCIHNRCT